MKGAASEMTSARSWPSGARFQTIQKAVGCSIGLEGVDPQAYAFDDLRRELKFATPRRLFAVAQALQQGMSIARSTT